MFKYTNFHFENNASGKMMLGIWFVFSKQYSDKLSEDITRGSTRQAVFGKAMGKPKAGYMINTEGYHEPDPENFSLIQEAFRRKLDGETDETITNFLNASGYKRILASGKGELEMNVKNIYRLWIDEFYYGILIYGDTVTDLRIVNPSYQPIITEEQYVILKNRYKEKTDFLLLTQERKKYLMI